jgi:DNA-binding NarL/FixJ family response regulator
LGPFRILVVDDFENWRRAIVSILGADPGLEIIGEASDGVAAVQRCWELKPDLVVLDVGLPNLNGLEAAKQIREVSPDTKILFLSANRSKEVAREALRMGAAGYILKENAGRELLAAVRSAVRDGEFLRFTILPDLETEEPEE